MKISLKLFATLSDYLPAESRHTHVIELDVTPQATIEQLIARYQLPPKLVHLVLVNGSYITPEKRATHQLVEGDVLAIWPPIAGGWLQSFYAERFERDMGCTEAEWLRWLPAAIGPHPWTLTGDAAQVRIGHGTLELHWQRGAPRVLGLIHMPRLLVRFDFAGLDEAQRLVFMKRFDLYMQRGGGWAVGAGGSVKWVFRSNVTGDSGIVTDIPVKVTAGIPATWPLQMVAAIGTAVYAVGTVLRMNETVRGV